MFTRVMERVFLQDTFPAQLLVAAVAVGLQDVGVVAAPLVRPRGRLPGAGPWGGGSAGLAEDGRGGVPGPLHQRRGDLGEGRQHGDAQPGDDLAVVALRAQEPAQRLQRGAAGAQRRRPQAGARAAAPLLQFAQQRLGLRRYCEMLIRDSCKIAAV